MPDLRRVVIKRIDILSVLKGGDSRLPRGLRVGYRFAALRRDKSRSYPRSTVVWSLRLSGGEDVDRGVDVPVVGDTTPSNHAEVRESRSGVRA